MPRDDLYLFEIVQAADHMRDFLRGVKVDAWSDDDCSAAASCKSLR